MAGTSSATSFSYSGYQERSPSGGAFHQPPEGSGLRLQPMKPSSFTQRSSSGMQFAGGTPGDCGSWQTGAKFDGYRLQTRWISSLHSRDQAWLTAASPTWCSIEPARGEKKVRSEPRSRCSLSCAPSSESRISWSGIFGPGGTPLEPDSWSFLQAHNPSGAVV